ncbi:MAG: tetratricopeptide repeat protein [Geminicoccales bacterium]
MRYMQRIEIIGRICALAAAAGLAAASSAPSPGSAQDGQSDPPGVWARRAIESSGVTSCPELVSLLRAEIAAGNDRALAYMGLLTETGDCVPRDYARAADYYQEVWTRGEDLIGARLGRLYLYGLGVPKSPARARELFQRAALRVSALSNQFEVLRTRVFPETTMPEEMAAAITWVEGLQRMEPEAQLALARRFRADTSRPQNRDIAYDFVDLAGRQGLAEAEYQHGRWLLADATSLEDAEDAVGLIDDAAQHCHLEAQIEMVWRHIWDLGVGRPYASDAEMYLRAAQRQGADMSAALWAFIYTFGGPSPSRMVERLPCG